MNIKVLGIELYLRKELLIAIAALLIAGIGIAGYIINNSDSAIVISSETAESASAKNERTITEPAAENSFDSEENPEKTEEIKVYVVGCVKNEGIVTLKKGQLIDDAIKAAGGATPDADLKNINLVYKLTDNAMLVIKSKRENELINQDKSSQNKPEGSGKAGTGVEIIKDSKGSVVSGAVSDEKNDGKININTAGVDELDTLPGIGEATAKKIIDFRQKNGNFKVISDIMKVSGIGESKFSKIKDYITVD